MAGTVKTPRWSKAPAIVLLAAALASADDVGDWRLELLAEEGLSQETANLLELREKFEMSPDRLEKAVGMLGAEAFAEREQAGRDLLLMGKPVLAALRRLPKSDDPEVRVRLLEIERVLQADGRWAREDLLRNAVASLVRERSGKGKGPTELLFAEFFNTPCPALDGLYRKFRFQADDDMAGLVSDGVLRMKGDHGGDGDQRLLLHASELPGKDSFPETFRIEVKLCGEAGGGGAFHVGVSVGNVRALFHPNFPGGGFRFEQVDTNRQMTPNADMGFDPPAGKPLLMSMDVKRLPKGKVGLTATIARPDGGEPFVGQAVVEADVIGELDHIGLDRSGRTGGDALFDDLVVDLGMR